jgi:hypothetical protein
MLPQNFEIPSDCLRLFQNIMPCKSIQKQQATSRPLFNPNKSKTRPTLADGKYKAFPCRAIREQVQPCAIIKPGSGNALQQVHLARRPLGRGWDQYFQLH